MHYKTDEQPQIYIYDPTKRFYNNMNSDQFLLKCMKIFFFFP